MIYVDSYEAVKSESSSKGNQQKFYKNGCWVKLDSQKCYEGLAEDFVSKFEACIVDFPFVEYFSDYINYNDDTYTGCLSLNMFSNKDMSFVPLGRLFKANNIPMKIFTHDEVVAENIKNVVEMVYRLTNVNISDYLFKMLFLDALIVNEDRHPMNIGIAKAGDLYGLAPCFDNGASLFCTNWTFRKSKSFEENMQSAMRVARPFSKFFDKQVEACKSLGARPLLIDKRKLDYMMISYNNHLYSDELNIRVKSVLSNRLTYYYDKGVFIYV